MAKFDNQPKRDMIRLIIPSGYERPLPFYLAMEEWAARVLAPGEYFFCWRVEPTVIIGRNQDIDTEVDLEYCRKHGIAVWRRRSGGGCIYADRDNIMMSYITDRTAVSDTFSDYTRQVASMLQQLGLDAHASGRNDVTVGERKISGNAFYHLPGRSIVHGTMLYDADTERMMRAITPSRSKLESKKVQSVAAHITTVRRHCDISMEDFIDHIYAQLCGDGEIVLSDSDIEAIELLERPYHDPSWIKGRSSDSASSNPGTSSVTTVRRIDGIGEFTVSIDTTDDNYIKNIRLSGDFFHSADSERQLSRLIGVSYDADTILKAIESVDTEAIASGLTRPQLATLLTQSFTK